MKSIDPHSLLNDEIKQIEVNGKISEIYNIWNKKQKSLNLTDLTNYDVFIAGYFLGTNPMLREKYMKENKSKKTNGMRFN